MNKIFQINIGPKISLKFQSNESDQKYKSINWKIFRVLSLLQKISWMVFFASFFVLPVFGGKNQEQATLIYLYFFVIWHFALHLSRSILVRDNFLPVVPFDLILLLFTTFVTSSLFLTTVAHETSYNIFGGRDFKAFSGVSIIAFCLLYFLGVAGYLTKVLKPWHLLILPFSFFSGMFCDYLINFEFLSDWKIIIWMIFPTILFLIFNKPSSKFKFGILFCEIILLIFNWDNHYAALISIILGIIIIIWKLLNIHRILKVMKNFSNDFRLVWQRKLSMSKFYKRNSLVFFMINAGLVYLIILVWLVYQNSFSSLLSNFHLANLPSLKAFWIGAGLQGSILSTISMILNSYGFFTFILFVLFIGFNFRQRYLYFQKVPVAGTIFLINLITFVVFFCLTKFNQMVLILFWLELLWFVLQSMKAKPGIAKPLEFHFWKNPKYYRYNSWIQSVLSMLLLLFGVYLIMLLKIIYSNIS
ncbi:MAG: hypothetical protein WCJ58_05000 [bacterium]